MENLEKGGYPNNNVATPKQLNELFVNVISNYVRNVKALNRDELEDFKRLDAATNANQLRQWAEKLHVSGSAGDVTSIELAKIIQTLDDKSLDALLLQSQSHPIILENKTNAILQQTEDLRSELPEKTVILYHNGEGNYTAVGTDAEKVAKHLGLLPDELLGSDQIPVININRSGVALLNNNAVVYSIVEPVTSLNMIDGHNNGMTQENKLHMQMGHLAVLSKGETVILNSEMPSNSILFNKHTAMELHKGTFFIFQKDSHDMQNTSSFPLQSFDIREGKPSSFAYMENEDIDLLTKFFDHNFEHLKQKVKDAPFRRKEEDNNFKKLIGQNDRLTEENPDTIILIKQKGFIEAFSTNAMKAAETLNLSLYNRTDYKNTITIPFAQMTVNDYKRLLDTENNIYLAKPCVSDNIALSNLTKVSSAISDLNKDLSQGNQQQSEVHSFKR